MSRVSTAVRSGAREIWRTPVLLALLVVLPAYLVGVFTLVAPETQVVLTLDGGETVQTTLTEAFPAFTTPMAAALLASVSALGTAVAVAVMGVAFIPEHPAWFVAAVFLAALLYGMVGVLAGSLLDRLPGVYLVLFGSMVDLFLFQNPLATDAPAAALLPGHYPVAPAVDAGFSSGVAVAPFLRGLWVLVALTALAAAAFGRAARP